MSSKKYESKQLFSILNSLFTENASGVLSLEAQTSPWQSPRSCTLILLDGALVYGDLNISQAPTNQEICHKIGQSLNPNSINAGLSVASKKISDPASTRQLIELLCKMRVFSLQQVESFVSNQVVLTLERFISLPGLSRWQQTDDYDLSYGADNHGLNWIEIDRQLKQRQQLWQGYKDLVPGMDSIPVVSVKQLQQVNNVQVREHFKNSVDGKNTLIDIADKMERDVLMITKNYHSWAYSGWVSFVQNPLQSKSRQAQAPIASQITPSSDSTSPATGNLPIVLSVDDSPIIQTTIKRALQKQYNVLLADQAAEALKILNQQPVQLLLLDLTMPDVDGLQFCRTIRQIPKFQNLPIIMVTARDGLVNKAKGHLAGTSRYLTKPFKPEELREVVSQYISQ